ncbi:BlaR1 family beta-lactam sensor/signal transducer [Virgibacillus halodenitrificans]|uniref:BlaR1 family beta-lactam sensor/signal transducer n=1 Tax=Virgibacillus halodenitrificans TaxID=1482 RepID=UPI001F458D44|nr:BlaR1 family beta-lactam sensor/signal transducer [Virgibacillus halodenitrificans]
MFALHLAESMFISSFTVILIILFKKLFHNHLSPKWKYNLWFILLLALTVPFLPEHLLDFLGGSHSDGEQINYQQSSNSSAPFTTIADGNWMNNYALSVNKMELPFINQFIVTIWLTGLLFMLALVIRSWINLRKIKKSLCLVKDQAILSLFAQCKHRLHISRKIVLAQSSLLKTPMTFGITRAYIVVPAHTQVKLTNNEWKYILLHELKHHKSKDIFTNYLVVLFQIIYWFNPLIWVAFKEMRLDREIACDHAVLKLLKQEDYKAYGNTIINFVDKTYLSGIVSQFASSKKQLKKRIRHIASFKNESRLLKGKSVLIFLTVTGIVLNQSSLASGMSYNNEQYHLDNERIVEEDLSSHFSKGDGSFVLYDLRKAKYFIYNKKKSTLRVSPNSTYKIYNALFALEDGVINSKHTALKWDGSNYPYEAWNKDQNLFSAMENSVTWYFQRLDRKLQLESIQAYIRAINYGNQDVSGGIDEYWLESSLKISPIEQVKTLKDFYTNQFDFDEKNIQLVKDTMKLESKENATLFGKTGTGSVNGKQVNGWFIGYVETKTNTYFFATNIEDKQHANGSTAAKITKNILQDKGIY